MARPIKYCSFCGSDNIIEIDGLTRCFDCRAVALVVFSRYMRKIRQKLMGDIEKEYPIEKKEGE